MIKNILKYTGLSVGTFFILTDLIPKCWKFANDSSTSFMANFWFILIALMLVVPALLVFLIILDYEVFYKKSRKYDISSRKWVRK